MLLSASILSALIPGISPRIGRREKQPRKAHV